MYTYVPWKPFVCSASNPDARPSSTETLIAAPKPSFQVVILTGTSGLIINETGIITGPVSDWGDWIVIFPLYIPVDIPDVLIPTFKTLSVDPFCESAVNQETSFVWLQLMVVPFAEKINIDRVSFDECPCTALNTIEPRMGTKFIGSQS